MTRILSRITTTNPWRYFSSRSSRSVIAAFATFALFSSTSIINGNNSDITRSLEQIVGTTADDLVRLYQTANFAEYESTLVFDYFTLKGSKHENNDYLGWAKFSMCIEDPVVIFTSPDLVEKFRDLRSHAENRTLIIPLDLEEVQTSNVRREKNFWENQKGGFNVNLYKLWLGKTWFVNQAIKLNPFKSNKYIYMDIGHFRDEGTLFCGKNVVRHPEIIPKDRIVLYPYRSLGLKPRKDFQRDPNPLWSDEYFYPHYIAGGVISGGADAWPIFLDKMEESIDMFNERGVSLTDDQGVMQSTCMRNPGLCYVTRWDSPFGEGNGECVGRNDKMKQCLKNGGWTYSTTAMNHFFSMKYRLYHGGDINTMYWDNALGTPTPDEDPGLYHPVVLEQLALEKEQE